MRPNTMFPLPSAHTWLAWHVAASGERKELIQALQLSREGF